MPDRYALILGSGCNDVLAGWPSRNCETTYGIPTSPLFEIEIAGHSVFALARHGLEQSIPAHAVNYRANIAALEAAGAQALIGLNTVGAITAVGVPGQLAVPEQLIDYTWGRQQSFFDGGDGRLRHIEFTQPFAQDLREQLGAAAVAADLACHEGGVYAVTQGPRLETAAEIDRLQRDGSDFVGMTAMPEASLAAEAGLRYACLALIVNKAAGRGDKPIHDDVAACTERARDSAMQLLQRFFAGKAAAAATD
jgi:purine nucleoside phosphorylase